MGAPLRHVQLGKDKASYPISFGSNAIYRLEEKTGQTIGRLAFLLQMGRGGVRLMQLFLWAALEGGRLKAKVPARRPFDVDEVGDLVDDTDGGAIEVWREPDDGGKDVEIKDADGNVTGTEKERVVIEPHPVMTAMMDAIRDAFPKAREGDKPHDPQ